MMKYNTIHRLATAVALVLLSTWVGSGISNGQVSAQTQQTVSDRKLITHVEPEYPEALKKLYIGGVVRVEVVIEPNGTVKSTKLLGGSPILGQSSMKAIQHWKYAPASAEQTLVVKVEFDPYR